MTLEKPLHVQVAEAVGWFACTPHPTLPDSPEWWGKREELLRHAPVPRYDTDWAATGPLIEKYKLNVEWDPGTVQWEAWYQPGKKWEDGAFGPTLLIAVCNLILALKEAGKLEVVAAQAAR